jgi:hypothetical protein
MRPAERRLCRTRWHRPLWTAIRGRMIDVPGTINAGGPVEEEPTMPTTERSGLAIHYEVEGSGLPLVLLHGGFTSSELWRLRGSARSGG